jgi:hypothetical protein
MYSSLNYYWCDKMEDRIGRYVAHQGGKFVCTGFWLENVKKRDRVKDLGIDGKTILILNPLKWKIL